MSCPGFDWAYYGAWIQGLAFHLVLRLSVDSILSLRHSMRHSMRHSICRSMRHS